jgi:hypothetical protein
MKFTPEQDEDDVPSPMPGEKFEHYKMRAFQLWKARRSASPKRLSPPAAGQPSRDPEAWDGQR